MTGVLSVVVPVASVAVRAEIGSFGESVSDDTKVVPFIAGTAFIKVSRFPR